MAADNNFIPENFNISMSAERGFYHGTKLYLLQNENNLFLQLFLIGDSGGTSEIAFKNQNFIRLMSFLIWSDTAWSDAIELSVPYFFADD